MSIVLLLFCAVPSMVCGGNFAVGSPDGASRSFSKTFNAGGMRKGKVTVNVNVQVNISQGGGGTIPGFTPTPGFSTTFPVGATTGAGTPGRSAGGMGPNPAGPPASPAGTPFAQDGLSAHNYFRSFHDSPSMTLNAEMNSACTTYAQTLASMGTLQHSSNSERPDQGENLYFSCSSSGEEVTATKAVKAWYDEVCNPGYNFGNGQTQFGALHFTQVVWKASTELGIGKANGNMGSMTCTYVVARYKPQGNFQGEFLDNVKAGTNFGKDAYCAQNSDRPADFRLHGALVKLGKPEHVTKQRHGRPNNKLQNIHLAKKEKINKKYRKHRH